MNKAEMIEKTHRHWCDVEGHEYECSGDCDCICGRRMNGNDHSDCPVELRPCPEHKAEQERRIAEAMSCEKQTEIEPLCEQRDAAPLPHCECGCCDIDFGKAIGWCFHCQHVYAVYSARLEDEHFANHCPAAPETVKEAARARLAKRGCAIRGGR